LKYLEKEDNDRSRSGDRHHKKSKKKRHHRSESSDSSDKHKRKCKDELIKKRNIPKK